MNHKILNYVQPHVSGKKIVQQLLDGSYSVRSDFCLKASIKEEESLLQDLFYILPSHTKGNHYTLETLVHCINNHHLKHTQYLDNIFALSIPSVKMPPYSPVTCIFHVVTGLAGSASRLRQG